MPRLIEEIQRAHPNLLVEPYVGVGELVERGLEEGEPGFCGDRRAIVARVHRVTLDRQRGV